MKTNLLAFLLLIALGTVKGQLSGTAFLQGQTNHSGIRVKFTAAGGTAVTDSAFTTASGNYSINITPGVYWITCAKAGYVDALYNGGGSVLLTNTTVVSAMTINPGNAVFVSGTVSGTWYASNVYVVSGDINIAAGSTLTVMPGTKVLFNGYYSINGDGVIKASGSPGNPILFSSNMQARTYTSWKQIGLNSSGSVFDNCIVEYANYALFFQNGSADITNSIFRHCGTFGIYMGLTGAPLIESNEVYDLNEATGNAAVAIWMNSPSGTVSCNYIHDIHSNQWNSYGIINGSSLVRDNHINNITGGNSAKGIQTRATGARNINNCISNSGVGIDIDGSSGTSNPIVANNILYANQNGILISGGPDPASPTIVNNLITGNVNGIVQYGSAGGTCTIDHNLVWGQSGANYSNVQLAGLGQIVSNNTAGYPIDSYYNMSQDPLYNGTAPLLSASSPCYGTGNMAYSAQIGFSNPQGCMATVVSIREWNNNISKLSVFPNPCPGVFTVSADAGQEMALSIFDMSGRMVHSATATPGQQVNVNDLANGVYVLTIKKGEMTGTTLLSISK